MSSLFTPYKLGPVTLRNRTIRSAAFESMGRHFGPTQQLKDYHVSVARGGVGMTTLAYAAVCRSGLSFDKQLWLRPEIVPGLRDITDAVHREGAAAGIQIGHCGNMTHLTTAGQIPIGASTGFNLYAYTPVRGMRAGEIEQVARDFGRAVHTAHDAGFDSVEVHAGHGYLISQFLSPYTNRRRDEYGGSLENRMRFMRLCLEEVMEAAAQTGLHYLSRPPEPLPKAAGEYRYRIEEADLLRALLSVFTRGGAASTDTLQLAAPKRIIYSVRDKCRTLIDELRERGSMSLNALYGQCASRSEIVATFLSVLELCSLGHLMLSEQNGEYVASFTGGTTDDILESIVE